MSIVHVAVAVIKNELNQTLIQQRAADTHQGGLWEFPGGKLEAGETLEQALQREIHEELGIQVESSRPLIKVSHDYGDRKVLLDVHLVRQWCGQIQAREQQPLQWVGDEDLNNYPMPEADRPIVSALQLPSSYVITPSQIETPDKLLIHLERLLEQGERLFLYRVKSLLGMRHEELIDAMLIRCHRHQAKLLIHEKNRQQLTKSIEADGRHLTEDSLMGIDSGNLSQGLLSVSCHSLEALKKAQAIGADFAMLSPVEETGSHPGVLPLGWPAFAEIVSQANIPVYALGGMTVDKLEKAWLHGAQGVAGISSWWAK